MSGKSKHGFDGDGDYVTSLAMDEGRIVSQDVHTSLVFSGHLICLCLLLHCEGTTQLLDTPPHDAVHQGFHTSETLADRAVV